MPRKRKRVQIQIYSKGTDKPRSYDIPLRVLGEWVVGLVIIVLGFTLWLPDNMINLKNFRVLEIAKEQKSMQLMANKLEKQIFEANSQIESGHNLREKMNQLAGLSSSTEEPGRKVIAKKQKDEELSADFQHLKKTLQTFRKARDALLEDEEYANNLPLLYPVKRHQNITNKFGFMQDPMTKRELPHRGLDFAVNEGDTVIATGDGVVENIVNRKYGFGVTLEIQHTPQIKTVYSHLQSVLVSMGKSSTPVPVKKGQPIALAGKTGSVMWTVLHYEVRYDNQPLNPEDYFLTQ
ncbi:MAG: M23 family metallopeptidase [Candidatus Fibromonas sp.]|jgi:murein DD-endopeptidase MepM/ murein hydrolase activator NlpD|nr:M23 family metallopeptidase [Candidatus Fibromonas sp.]